MVDTLARKTPPKASKSVALKKTLLAGLVLGLLAFAGIIGGGFGYQHGAALAAEVQLPPGDEVVDAQYQLGLEDYQAGNYELARQRFEYVVAFAPDAYPHAWVALTEILQILDTTATPTLTLPPPTIPPSPTITLTPTPDPSGVESIYQRAQSLLAAGDWDGAIAALIALRNEYLTYRVFEVDDSFFAALRNRGEQRILNLGDLEGGIYDLSLAEKFGPLDYQATVYRGWARLYLTGLGFWEAYPEQAVFYFGQVAAAVPGLRDGTGSSAGWRYRMSLLDYGAQLAAEKHWCEAQQQYELAVQFGGGEEDLPLTLTHVAYKCSPPTQTISPTPSIAASATISLTPTNGPSFTPTLALPTSTASGVPTASRTSALPTNTLTSIPAATSTSLSSPTATSALPTYTATVLSPPTVTSSPIPLPTATPIPPTNTPIPPSITPTTP